MNGIRERRIREKQVERRHERFRRKFQCGPEQVETREFNEKNIQGLNSESDFSSTFFIPTRATLSR